MSSKIALVIMDMQQCNFDNQHPIVGGDSLLGVAKELIQKARAADIPIVYVLNDGGKGAWDESGTPGWEIHSDITPNEGDILIEKTTPDAFHQTGLEEVLNIRSIKNLVVMGLQTEFCIDTTCRRGSILGYSIVLVRDGHSTWDSDILSASQIIAHHSSILGDWFVELKYAKEIDFSR
ncbi:MAG: cysteine hydrolase family protein [Candidatus Thorarchaeota archaeon]